jgi:hypothetical protein
MEPEYDIVIHCEKNELEQYIHRMAAERQT